jgi:sugar phosphate isomerase/epimerase
MNHPARNLNDQIDWIASAEFGFLDLTLEPPCAASWSVDAAALRDRLVKHGLQVVGHTAPYLPIASPMEGLRGAAIEEFKKCLVLFSKIGVKWMNVHPGTSPMHPRRFSIQKNLESLRQLVDFAGEIGVGVMIENVPGSFNNAEQLAELLDPLPELGLHLDVGHCNLMNPCNTEQEILAAYGPRLRHVHLHDNRGGNLDLHLPLGVGSIDIPQALGALKNACYDGTITLEVFTDDLNHLLYSRDVLARVWSAA